MGNANVGLLMDALTGNGGAGGWNAVAQYIKDNPDGKVVIDGAGVATIAVTPFASFIISGDDETITLGTLPKELLTRHSVAGIDLAYVQGTVTITNEGVVASCRCVFLCV
jgi:hypothetical protein